MATFNGIEYDELGFIADEFGIGFAGLGSAEMYENIRQSLETVNGIPFELVKLDNQTWPNAVAIRPVVN